MNRHSESFVYVVAATNGYTKIGRADTPFERFSSLQTCSPLPLTLSYVCQSERAKEIEAAAHKTLHAARRHREWFEVSPELAIATVRSAMDALGIGARESAPQRAKTAKLRAEIHEIAVGLQAVEKFIGPYSSPRANSVRRDKDRPNR